MTTVYVYVMNTMADWEIGYCLAELHSKRFFRKNSREIMVKTVSLSKKPVKSMGGLTIVPDLMIKDIQTNKDNVLILPGSDRWGEAENVEILGIAKKLLERKMPIEDIQEITLLSKEEIEKLKIK